MERLFLKEISNYYNHKNTGLLSPLKMNDILRKKYEFSVHFPLK